MRFLILLLFINFYACGQQTGSKKYAIDPAAKNLNDSAVSIVVNSDNYEKAIALLDKAIQIDTNYLMAYTNKLSFQFALQHFDQALQTALKLNWLAPDNPEYYVTIGMLYYFKKDTIASYKSFSKATVLYESISDTMNIINKRYSSVLMNKAMTLLFLGREMECNNILRNLFQEQTDESFKELLSSFMNKSKKDILDSLLQIKQ